MPCLRRLALAASCTLRAMCLTRRTSTAGSLGKLGKRAQVVSMRCSVASKTCMVGSRPDSGTHATSVYYICKVFNHVSPCRMPWHAPRRAGAGDGAQKTRHEGGSKMKMEARVGIEPAYTALQAAA